MHYIPKTLNMINASIKVFGSRVVFYALFFVRNHELGKMINNNEM